METKELINLLENQLEMYKDGAKMIDACTFSNKKELQDINAGQQNAIARVLRIVRG